MLHVTALLPPEHWLAIQITHFNRIDERDEGFLSAAGLPNYGIKKAQDCVFGSTFALNRLSISLLRGLPLKMAQSKCRIIRKKKLKKHCADQP